MRYNMCSKQNDSKQKWNSDKCWCECKKLIIHQICKEDCLDS